MNNKCRLLLLIAIFISSCAGTAAVSKKPVAGGINGGKEYPSSKYLTAEGIGRSQSEARDRAKAESIRQIKRPSPEMMNRKSVFFHLLISKVWRSERSGMMKNREIIMPSLY